MQVAVFSQYLKEGDLPYVQHLLDALAQSGIAASIFLPYLDTIRDKVTFPANPDIFSDYEDLQRQKPDFIITLGGDGTILAAMTQVRETEIPILGINLGKLGFLATVNKNRIAEAVRNLQEGRYVISSRQTLHLDADPPLFGDTPFALNDFTILKRDTSSMITIHAYIDGVYLNTYWADGIILSTPTGSTGYSLSCGGPIVFPDSNNFVLTPVAPHNLNMRPLVISDASVISFQVEGRSENYLCTMDSRHEVISSANKLVLRRGDFVANIIELFESSFPGTIRNKLAWGVDLRNH
jgi:NAD+ kinase